MSIFISYASPDRETARQLAGSLRQRGHDVWWDRTIPPGRVFDEVIQEALSSAKCVIVLWSSHALRSNWVKVEAEEAAARNRLVPVMIEDVVPPMQFRRIQAANLVGWNMDPDHPEFQSILSSIERLLGASDNAPPTLPVASPRNAALPMRQRSRVLQVVGFAGAAALAAIAALLLSRIYDRQTPDRSRQTGSERLTDAPRGQQPSTRSERRSEGSDGAAAMPIRGERINLVAPENGGQLIAAADEKWAATIDGDEKTSLWIPFYTGGTSEAVFGFKGGRSATFDTVEVLIPGTSPNNVGEFELLTGDEALTGRFESIQMFKTQNALIVAKPFQRFTFTPRTARFVKFRVLRSHADLTSSELFEWRLLGSLR